MTTWDSILSLGSMVKTVDTVEARSRGVETTVAPAAATSAVAASLTKGEVREDKGRGEGGGGQDMRWEGTLR